MKPDKLPPPNQVKMRFNSYVKDWQAELDGIYRAYKEAYGGFHQVQVIPDRERISTSGVSRPTETAALDTKRRRKAEYALWKVDCVLEDLRAARKEMDASVGPLNLSAPGELPADPSQGIYKLGSRKAKAQQKHFRQIQERRRARGYD